MAKIHIGTSGWHYDHWVGPFYPQGMASGAFLAHYARHFRTVEINNSFYRLPKPEALAKWRDGSPDDMVFACKASRYLTHVKKLKDEGGFERFFDAVKVLGEKLGPILFQLPPRWHANADRLDDFLKVLPQGLRSVFELRDRSWFVPEVHRVLERHGAACCAYDFDGFRSPVWLTADFVYVRLHGPGQRYRGSYSGQALAAWAKRLRGWKSEGCDSYCYFDNDEKGFAVQDALRLQDLLRRR